MTQVVDGKSVFCFHWWCWRMLGQVQPKKYKALYYLYSMTSLVFITILYPMHLVIALLTSKTPYEAFQNLAINLTCVVCVIKTFIIWWKQDKVRHISEIIDKFDKRITEPDEVAYYERTVIPASKAVFQVFGAMCFVTTLSAEIALIIEGLFGKWNLMYPGYFPMDPFESTLTYVVAHVYQFVGITMLIWQNLANDTLGGVTLAMLAGHVRLLGMRMKRIGRDPNTSPEENSAQLAECIQDFRELLEFHEQTVNIISMGSFIQILCTGFNMCVTVVFMLFYIENRYSFFYYMVYLVDMPMEIFPLCFYGTALTLEFEKFPYAAFSCNWIDQSTSFKQNLRILIEQALRARPTMAGGILRIDLDTFFSASRAAYSLFAVVMNMR